MIVNMVFFSDFNVPKDYAIGITNLLGNITTKDHSHKGGWAKLLKCQLINAGYKNVEIIGKNNNISSYDCIVFDLGAEFSGGLNLFGGLDDKVFSRLVDLYQFTGPMFSWQHELPDISVLSSRKNNVSTCRTFKAVDDDFIPLLKARLDKCSKFDHVEFKPHLLFGDSHTPSVWTPDMMIERQDGRSLFGTVKSNTLHKIVTKYTDIGLTINEITFYAGNIDIRHHLMRQNQPWDSAIFLASTLEGYLVPYATTMKINITSMLPIENIERKLPKTGFYKGTPYFGTWNERSALHEILNGEIERFCLANSWQIYKHPREFYNKISELKFEVMERPKSVHLSPMFYRWDLDNNKERYNGY